jgi:16S rRNA (guanine1516-N2)-methyltransferase
MEDEISIIETPEGLQLVHSHNELPAFILNFLDPLYLKRWNQFNKRDPLARAIGIKAGKIPSVVDATAGFGRDTVLLTRLGCSLTLVERHPLIARILSDAVERFKMAKTDLPKIEVVHANSIHYLQQQHSSPDVIYCDPMFPKRNKSAQVKKASQWLRVLAGEAVDEIELLHIAQKSARRIVVKRPNWADCVGESDPNFQIQAGDYRFDVYLTEI